MLYDNCLYVFSSLFLFLNTARTTTELHRLKRLTKEDICHRTTETLQNVTNCPKNESIFREQSIQKNCERYPKCNGEPLIYHCVRFKDSLVEVCAPKRVIKGKCCPVFDRGIGRVIEDFKKPCPECPFIYQSVDSVKYSACVKSEPLLHQNTSDDSNSNTRETTSKPCCKSNHCKRTSEDCTEQQLTTQVVVGKENPNPSNKIEIIFIIIPVSGLLFICLGIVSFGCHGFWRRKSTCLRFEKNGDTCTSLPFIENR